MTPPPPPPIPQPADGRPPEHEECVEQAYFFRTFRERLEQNLPSQDILRSIHEDVLPSTRLPTAVEFLSSDMKHTGRLSTGFARLAHYFTPFQGFVVQQAENDRQRLTMPVALLILEREAAYKAEHAKGGAADSGRAGLFVYQFETIARNRLGYDEGLGCVARDPIYGPDWASLRRTGPPLGGRHRLLRPGLPAVGAACDRRAPPAARLRSRRCRPSSGSGRAGLRRPAAAATRCSCSPRSSGS